MSVTEETLAEDIAARLDPIASGSAAVEESSEGEVEKFEFDAEFQTKVAAMAVRDAVFNERAEGLVRPEYFENVAEAAVVNTVQRYFGKYKRVPDLTTLMHLIKEDISKKIIRKDMIGEVREAIRNLARTDIGDRDYVIEQVSEFARYQALSKAILDSVGDLETRSFDRVLERVKKALDVGANEMQGAYDYWERISQRTETRKAEAAGLIKPNGITTGVKVLDNVLKHKGWGRKELSVMMGGPKAGKSTALGMFAKNASLAGYNVLVCTLEVNNEIIADRLDASIAEIAMSSLSDHIIDIESRIEAAGKKAGKLIMHEYPTGTMTPTMLRRLLARYKAQGINFDLVVVDYADIMAPDYRTDSAIENSKSIYVGLRAIAQEENLAMLSATQTNREGAKSAIAGMEHVAEDFNKVRIADILISINASDEEKKRNEARLYFAASRNQKGDITIRIQQDLERMIFIKKILGIE